MIYHTEVCALRDGDGDWADWGRLSFDWEEGRLQDEEDEREKIKKRTWNWIRWITIWRFLTVAACGSSPQAQCIVGFVESNGLVISSESLLGEVGRELPGLKGINKN